MIVCLLCWLLFKQIPIHNLFRAMINDWNVAGAGVLILSSFQAKIIKKNIPFQNIIKMVQAKSACIMFMVSERFKMIRYTRAHTHSRSSLYTQLLCQRTRVYWGWFIGTFKFRTFGSFYWWHIFDSFFSCLFVIFEAIVNNIYCDSLFNVCTSYDFIVVAVVIWCALLLFHFHYLQWIHLLHMICTHTKNENKNKNLARTMIR